ncbi:hypothetical protein L910_3492 [Vibrio fluvialis PG41]|uniref:Uncharacterized protein n=1 Tax=Vibrio fluvialis PG41 TaxID=1336752 RepID=S7J5B3_VIBFL|nr:hypothetical protein L910_3492 [Vibrio fluvialis PG41]
MRWIDIFQHGIYPDVTVDFIPLILVTGAKNAESPIKQKENDKILCLKQIKV